MYICLAYMKIKIKNLLLGRLKTNKKNFFLFLFCLYFLFDVNVSFMLYDMANKHTLQHTKIQ